MKAKDIKEFKITEGCYGEQLSVNGIDYDDLSEKDVIEFITGMIENDLNRHSLIKETFVNALHYLCFDNYHEDDGICDQCGELVKSITYIRE